MSLYSYEPSTPQLLGILEIESFFFYNLGMLPIWLPLTYIQSLLFLEKIHTEPEER